MKKLMLCIVLLSGIYGCCNDTPLYWGFNDVTIDLLDTDEKLVTSTTYDDDFLYLDLFPTAELFSQQSMMIGGTSLYAFTYPESGENGLKDKLSKIEVTCNEVYEGIPAGELINDEVTFTYLRSVNGFMMEDLINEINGTPYYTATSYSDFFLRLLLSDNPSDDLEREFTVRFEFDSTRAFEQTSSTIRWN